MNPRTKSLALLATMALCFLGLGMLISAIARSTDMAQGAAFMTWLVLLLFLDLILVLLLKFQRFSYQYLKLLKQLFRQLFELQKVCFF